jgi:hypothetical protein
MSDLHSTLLVCKNTYLAYYLVFTTSNKKSFAGTVQTENEIFTLPFCNREKALYELLIGFFLNWVKTLPINFVEQFNATQLQTLTQKVEFQGAITTMGMGKTRILTDWSKEVWKHNDILEDFSTLNWIVAYKSDFSSRTTKSTQVLSPTLRVPYKGAQPFQLKAVILSKHMRPEDLAALYLWELKDAVESSRYIGVKIQPGLVSFFNREKIKQILNRSALYSLFEAASGIIPHLLIFT